MQIVAAYTGTEMIVHAAGCPDAMTVAQGMGDPACRELLILSPADRGEAVRRLWTEGLATPKRFSGGRPVLYPELTHFAPCCAGLPEPPKPTIRQGTVLRTLAGRGSMTAVLIGVRSDVLWRMEERGWVTSSGMIRRADERWTITATGHEALDRLEATRA